MNKIAFIGVGLIGGCLALEIKDLFPDSEIIGIDQNPENLQDAFDLKIIDTQGTMEDLTSADLVFVSIPVDKIATILPYVLDQIKDTALIIDMGSTKMEICKAVENHPKRTSFLAAHPIAGTEFSGAKSAFKGLFKTKTMIICEVEKTAFKYQELALKIFHQMGMRIRYMSPETHDKHIAYVSHLSHITSYMLGKTVMEKEEDERDIFDMAGSGFASTVRLAKSSASMWTPIFQQNRYYLLDCIDEYINNMKQFKELLKQENYPQIFEQIQEINNIKYILEGNKN